MTSVVFFQTMDTKLMVCLAIMAVVALHVSNVDGYRLCFGTRSTCRDNPYLVSRRRGCSDQYSDRECRPYGFNSCRCLPSLGSVFAQEGDVEATEAANEEENED